MLKMLMRWCGLCILIVFRDFTRMITICNFNLINAPHWEVTKLHTGFERIKKEMAALLHSTREWRNQCSGQELPPSTCLEVKCDFEQTLHFTLDLVLFLRYSLSCARRFTRWSSMARRQCSFGCSSRASFSTTWPQWLTQGDQTTSKHSTFADGVSFYLFRFIIDRSCLKMSHN